MGWRSVRWDGMEVSEVGWMEVSEVGWMERSVRWDGWRGQ